MSAKKSLQGVLILAKIGFTLGCIFLFLISLWIIALAIVSIIGDIRMGGFNVYKLLDEVGLLVFSIAVIDVAKYLMVEEVFKGSENANPVKSRHALTKFVIIIVTALSLEGLVLTIETLKTDVTKIVYPVLLLIAAVIFMLGLAVYNRLTQDRS